MSLYCEYSSLISESDVEQKFIYRLLISPHPIGLGFGDTDILTKHVLKPYIIGKSKPKSYYPDYVIAMRGIPLLVVEAKAPNEDLGTAFSEARLYATEVNAKFPHGINVCNKIIVSNGKETWAGFHDDAIPAIKLYFEDINTENIYFNKLLKFCNKEILSTSANIPYLKLRGGATYVSPVSSLGGKRVQDEELVENTYGRTLVFENRGIFDPQSEIDKIEIVKNAYVPSSKREQHVDPIFREIKKIKLPSEINSTLISTDDPREVASKIKKHIITPDSNDYSLLLLIGSVGSGKSTFIRYFKEVVIDRDYIELALRCEWIFINMNPAPVNNDEIYNWIRYQMLEAIKNNHKDIDFNSIDIIKRVFRDEIKIFENGIGDIIRSDDKTYNIELYKLLHELICEDEKSLKGILKYIKDYARKVPIIVLDNCDKRNRDEQLLMFEVAQWIRNNYKCIVVLPMRDRTYDIYKREPPLDTVVKDLVFRIDPPDLLKVLQKRLEYIERLREAEGDRYGLESGATVIIKPREQIEYFRCILTAIRNNRQALRIFYALSNRDVRSSIQLFEDFCKSGHIKAEDIFKIRTTDYMIPSEKLINALLRKNRRFFSEETSNFINMFYSNFRDDFPDPFVRIDILLWLRKNYLVDGPNKIKGYHKVESIVQALQIIGHSENVIYREIQTLVRRGLIFTESQIDDVKYGDLISLSPSGTIHIWLLKNLNYLAACGEEVVYKEVQVAKTISERIASENYLDNIPMTIATTKNMLDYLKRYRKYYISNPEAYVNDEDLHIYDMSDIYYMINEMLEKNLEARRYIQMLDKYYVGVEVECKIVYKSFNSLLCNLEGDVRGFLAPTNYIYKLTKDNYDSLTKGDYIKCRIISYDNFHNSFQLEYIRKI